MDEEPEIVGEDIWDWGRYPDSKDGEFDCFIVPSLTAQYIVYNLSLMLVAAWSNPDFKPSAEHNGVKWTAVMKQLMDSAAARAPAVVCIDCFKCFMRQAATLRTRYQTFAMEENKTILSGEPNGGHWHE